MAIWLSNVSSSKRKESRHRQSQGRGSVKLNRTYYVWIDPLTGHIWNDCGHKNIKEAKKYYELLKINFWKNAHELKLKKVKIVEIKEPK